MCTTLSTLNKLAKAEHVAPNSLHFYLKQWGGLSSGKLFSDFRVDDGGRAKTERREVELLRSLGRDGDGGGGVGCSWLLGGGARAVLCSCFMPYHYCEDLQPS